MELKNRPVISATTNHLPFLDGVRGLAILLVLLYHCFPDYKITEIGWIGVDLFFVLSGFLITGILLKTRSKPNYFKNFLIRRALRIFPLYFFFLLLVFIILPVLTPGILRDFGYYQQNQLWFWLYLQNWLYSLEGFPKNFSLHHLWSLAVEEQFYLFWPVIVYFTPSKRLILITLLLIICANIFRFTGEGLGLVFPYQYVNTISRMDSLLWGSMTAILLIRHPLLLKKLSVPILILTSFSFVIYIFYKKSFTFWSFELIYSLIALIFASLISITFFSYQLSYFFKRAFEIKLLIWLGKYSYGIYIYHYPVYLAFLSFLLPWLIYIFGTGIFANTLNGLISILITFLIARFSYISLEKPFLKLKSRFSK